ncbi:hypothetical protein TIFTF001_002604 [Ficus carica]|uniref:Uncharacterized protein n=1 Tax=Ficus carica TaxID=3494 RepID=A0AA87ZCC2_FICCA|nr:hypothetical protein TIFTF001_002604 [Ficus carica]
MFKKLKSRPLKFQFKENVRSHHLGVLYEQRSKGWETNKTSCQQSLHYNIQRKAVVEVGSSNKFVCDKIIEEAFVLEGEIEEVFPVQKEVKQEKGTLGAENVFDTPLVCNDYCTQQISSVFIEATTSKDLL